MESVFAQTLKIKTGTGTQDIKGPLQGINNLGDVVSKVMPFLIGFAAIILFLVLIWGGYDYLVSQGDPERIKGARAKITTALIGFVLLIASYALVRVIAAAFGLGAGIF